MGVSSCHSGGGMGWGGGKCFDLKVKCKNGSSLMSLTW